MKKYVPSVKANNDLKAEIVSEIKAFTYKLEKGKYNSALESETVSELAHQLKELYVSLDETIGTGDENVGALYNEALSQVKVLKKQADQPLLHRFESAVEDLSYTIGLWKDVLDDVTVLETPEDIEKEKVTRTRKKLNARLGELEGIKSDFVANGKRIEAEIVSLEKDLNEYNTAMLAEDNERKINELFREIKAVKSKIDMLSVRKNNYSACYNLLDMIYANANEILLASDFVAEEIARAKVLLNIEKLKKVVVDPEKAINILKQMDKDIKEISVRTATMDQKVFGLETGAATVSNDALSYKEELIRKQREKENSNIDIPEHSAVVNNEQIHTEEK